MTDKNKINKSIDEFKPKTLDDLFELISKIKESESFGSLSTIELQKILDGMLHGSKKDQRLYDFSQDLKSILFDMNDEFHELLSELPHKTWKQNKMLSINDAEFIKSNGVNILMEMIDSYFFFNKMMNMIIDKIKPSTILSNTDIAKGLYMVKYFNNIKRVTDGDFELRYPLSDNNKKILNNLDNMFIGVK